MNDTISDINSIVQISEETDTAGFDLRLGKTWIYPTNYPVREYQYNITQAALHQNTLVSLPTGLGKTFIAAVVMYNYYRWYPMGKIIFMAPTKPLVTQQMDACYNIMAIPKNVTSQMTGSKVNTARAKLWKEKRVFFITPQILQNDIDTVLDLAKEIKCIVIDEAHKALGKNANCEAIRKIHCINSNFRILALSATPGSNFNSIRDVITNLLISHIEVRTNESKDVAPYVFQRKMETNVIPINGKLLEVKNQYIKVLDRYTRPLLEFNVITGNCANLTKGRIVLTMKEFKERSRNHNKYGYVLKTLNICVTLYHAYELLIRHGLRAFLLFFQENISRPLINCIPEIHKITDDLQRYLGPLEDVEMLPDGTIPEIQGPIVYSHPKFQKLSEVLKSHFNQVQDADTRVMVFCEYRESVMEIYSLLLRYRPLIKPRIFLGQGAISQAQQLQAVKMFKSGQCNTLVSTCIGEEGLDVGEVDLIVCFDISSKSPIRMVQRMGRTGRKRDGRVVILVTEGKEQQLLSECLVQKNNMNSLLESQPIKQYLYKFNPKMIPNNIKPECNQMYITAEEPETSVKKKSEQKNTKKNKSNNNIKNMFDNMVASQSSSKSTTSSKNTTASRKSSRKSSPGKKQTDLRSMFTNIINTQTSCATQVVIDDDTTCIEDNSEEFKNLISTMKSYLNQSIINNGCELCDNLFNCEKMCVKNLSGRDLIHKNSELVYDNISIDSLNIFADTLVPFKIENNSEIFDKSCSNLEDTLEFFQINSTFDIFQDSSEEDKCGLDNAALFNSSIGIFNSSKIFTSQSLIQTQQKNTDNLNETNSNKRKSDTPLEKTTNKFAKFDDDIVIVESDTEQSPILNRNRNYVEFKSSVQRKLFSQVKTSSNANESINNDDIILDSQSVTKHSPILTTTRNPVEFKNTVQRKLFSQVSSSPNSNISKDLKQLDSLHGSEIITPQKTPSKNNKTASTSNTTKLNRFSFQKSSNNTLSNFNKLDSCNTNKSSSLNISSIAESTLETNKIDNDINKNKVSSAPTVSTPKADNKSFDSSKNDPSIFEQNIDFWDESLFEICDSDENENKNKTNSPKTENNIKASDDVSTKNANNDLSDSDDTIILSFNTDNLFQELENENKPEKNEQKNNTTIDNSLLTVTQLIDLINDPNRKDNTTLNNSNLNTAKCNEKTSETDLIVAESPELMEESDPILDKLLLSSDDDKHVNNSIKNTSEIVNSMLDGINFDDDDDEEDENLLKISQTLLDFNTKSKDNSQSSNTNQNSNPIDVIDLCDSDDDFSLLSFSQNNKNKFSKTQSFSQKNDKKIITTSQQDAITKNIIKTNENITVSNNRNKKLKLQLNKTNISPVHNKSVNQSTNLSQDSPLKITKKTRLCRNVILSDSDDDDFEPRRKEPVVSKLTQEPTKKEKTKFCLSTKTNDSNNFKLPSKPKSICGAKPKAKKTLAHIFFDQEAEVSMDEHYESDSEEDVDGPLEASFISDTQSILNDTDMQAKYLQSIRSPKKYNPFKRPLLPVNTNIFSQEENLENDTYIVDSFVIDNDVSLTQQPEMSYLEMIEAKLEKKMKKEKKRKKTLIVLDDSD